MATVAADWTKQWAEQLADVADHVMKEIPEKGDWDTVRRFLTNTTRMLRNGDVKSGFRAVIKILPYIQRAVGSVEKYNNINSSFDLADSVSKHFLVSDSHKEEINELLQTLESKISILRTSIENLAKQLDAALNDVIEQGISLGWWQGLRLAFEINRISALIKTSEFYLQTIRTQIDELDSHVAGKTFLAYVFTYIAFIVGVVFSASGNVPVGAACISTATATRKAAKSLDEYRKEIIALDRKHTTLQGELTEWKNNFTAEQRNFLFLFGPQKITVLLVFMFVTLLLIGRTGNVIVFCFLIGLLLFKTHLSESNRYNVSLLVAAMGIWMEYQKLYGIISFNFAGCLLFIANYIGLVDFWW